MEEPGPNGGKLQKMCRNQVKGTEDLVKGTEDLVKGTEDLVKGTEDLVKGTEDLVKVYTTGEDAMVSCKGAIHLVRDG